MVPVQAGDAPFLFWKAACDEDRKQPEDGAVGDERHVLGAPIGAPPSWRSISPAEARSLAQNPAARLSH